MSAADHALEAAQTAYLTRVAPGHRIRRVRWSGGTTQAIELGAGPPLVLLHGGLGEAFQWGPLLPALARTHHVIAVDRPGHGLADPFDSRTVDLLAHATEFLRDILDAENLVHPTLVGASMGGLWSIAFALAHPQRVARLVLVGSPAGITRTMPRMLRLGTLPGLRTLIRHAMRQPTRAAVRSFWAQLLVAHPERLDDDFLDLSAYSQRRNADSWFALIDRTMNLRGMRPDLLLGDRLLRLTTPTTMIWGDRDAWAPPALGEAAAARNPLLRLVRIPDAGHAPWFDQPELVLTAIQNAVA